MLLQEDGKDKQDNGNLMKHDRNNEFLYLNVCMFILQTRLQVASKFMPVSSIIIGKYNSVDIFSIDQFLLVRQTVSLLRSFCLLCNISSTS